MELPELRDIMPAETLALVIAGNTYVIEACSARDFQAMGVVLDQLRTAESGATLAVTTTELQELALGSTRQQMVDGGLTYAELTRSAWTAFYWHLGLEEAARGMWRGTPEPAPAPAKRVRKKAAAS